MDVTVVICTRNRAEALSLVLHRLIPMLEDNGALNAELLVVDNASCDGTSTVVDWYVNHFNFPVRRVYEANLGLSHARNRGLREAKGEIVVYLDDDAFPTREDWIEKLCRPVVDGCCAAATGRITVPPHLVRPWMTDWHRLWMGSTEEFDDPATQPWLRGGNMAIRTEIARRVPGGFSAKLGAGALGYGEETLFCYELLRQGHRIVFVPEAEVLHCMDPGRLTRREWLKQAERRGRSLPYQDILLGRPLTERPGFNMILSLVRLWRARLKRPWLLVDKYQAPAWELGLVSQIACCRAVLKIKSEGLEHVYLAPPARVEASVSVKEL